MKKVLLATSALVAFGGAASAEIAFSGYARFGVQYAEGATTTTAAQAATTTSGNFTYYDASADAIVEVANGSAAVTLDTGDHVIGGTNGTAAVAASTTTADDSTSIDQRFNIDVNGSMESEGGLTFGAKVRMRAEEAGDNGTVMTMNGARYFVSAGGMELAVGNIYGAIDSMSGLYAGSVGLTGLGWGNVVSNFGSQTYSSRGAGVNGVELIYSVGDLSLHLSTVKDANTEVAVGYAMNGVNVAVAFSNSDADADAEWVATIGTKLGGVGVGLAAAQSVAGNTSMTLSGSFAAGAATSVNVYLANDEGQAEETAYGIGVVHQLGGGASVRGGFANTHGINRADLGVQFNF